MNSDVRVAVHVVEILNSLFCEVSSFTGLQLSLVSLLLSSE